MIEASNRKDAGLEQLARDKQDLVKTIREQMATPGNATVVRNARWWVSLSLAAAALLGACGGGSSKRDTYARGTQVQEQCCEHLQGAGRDQCLQQIVRVNDPEVAKTSTNQSQYACVVDHFQCDAQTGHATQTSAQAQLDCIQDLQ